MFKIPVMEKIQEALREIEHRQGVRILYACETGSRAWGFPSPDSDYDIRFVYIHKRDWYLSLSEKKDTVESMIGELDITGWDLRKCLRLLKKSNAPLIERFNSPVIYREEGEFRETFSQLVQLYYSPTAVFYHHFSQARKFQAELEGKKEIKLKSYFYMVRSLLSCLWISRDTAVVPMNIGALMQSLPVHQSQWLNELIGLKAQVDEKYLHRRTADMDEMIREWFTIAEAAAGKLPVNQADSTALDQFFIKMLNSYADY